MNKRLFQPLSIGLMLTASSMGLVTGIQWITANPSLSSHGLAYGATSTSAPARLASTTTGQIGHADHQSSATATPYEVCVHLPDWQRPSEQDQKKQLEAMPRYGTALQEEPLLSLAKAWWSHEVFSFTTYGLSARTDPHYLSGLWTALDTIWDCYNGDQPQLINAGEMAELWLLHHQLVDIQWLGDQYLITVEPGLSGLQLVQFERQDPQEELLISVITTDGEPVATMSGDW